MPDLDALRNARDLVEVAHCKLIDAAAHALKREVNDHKVELVKSLREGKLAEDWDGVRLSVLAGEAFDLFTKLDNEVSAWESKW